MAAEFEPVIGLEIHAQLDTASKMFCGCAGKSAASPNSAVCPVCTGQPGALPALNKAAVALAVKAALGFGCKLNMRSVFARKNYFYPDCPKNYQISQHELPIALEGAVEIPSGEQDALKRIRLTRIHMEEDAGKSLHAVGSEDLSYSLVDFNRSGMPLIEIVSEPDIRSPQEAYSFLTALKTTLSWTGVSSCDMEKGELRVDVNISLRPRGEERFGTKIEIKNLNSFKAVKDALAHEIERQAAALSSGAKLSQETRLWDEKAGATALMRSKEEAHDYRYFPEPDLPPLELDEKFVADIRESMPELPLARRARFVKQYSLSDYDAGVMTGSRELADYFEKTASSAAIAPKQAVNWIGNELMGRLNAEKLVIENSPIAPDALAELALLIEKGGISGKMGKEVFDKMWQTRKRAKEIVQSSGMAQVSDSAQIEQWAKEAIAANPKAAEDVRGGNEKAVGALVGFVMKKSKGKANPALLNETLKTLLK